MDLEVLAGEQRMYPSKALMVRLHKASHEQYGSQQNLMLLSGKSAEHLLQNPKRGKGSVASA